MMDAENALSVFLKFESEAQALAAFWPGKAKKGVKAYRLAGSPQNKKTATGLFPTILTSDHPTKRTGFLFFKTQTKGKNPSVFAVLKGRGRKKTNKIAACYGIFPGQIMKKASRLMKCRR